MSTWFFSSYASLLISFASTPAWQSRRSPLSLLPLPTFFLIPTSAISFLCPFFTSYWELCLINLSYNTVPTYLPNIFHRNFCSIIFFLYVSYSSLASLRFVDSLHCLNTRCHILSFSLLSFRSLVSPLPCVFCLFYLTYTSPASTK